ELDIQHSTRDRPESRFRDHIGWQQPLARINEGDLLAQGRLLALIATSVIERSGELLAIVREKPTQRLLQRGARIDSDLGILLTQQRISADVIEVPMRVDDRPDRLTTRRRRLQDLLSVLGMSAGVENDQPLWSIDENRVAVRLRRE